MSSLSVNFSRDQREELPKTNWLLPLFCFQMFKSMGFLRWIKMVVGFLPFQAAQKGWPFSPGGDEPCRFCLISVLQECKVEPESSGVLTFWIGSILWENLKNERGTKVQLTKSRNKETKHQTKMKQQIQFQQKDLQILYKLWDFGPVDFVIHVAHGSWRWPFEVYLMA